MANAKVQKGDVHAATQNHNTLPRIIFCLKNKASEQYAKNFMRIAMLNKLKLQGL